MFYFFLHRVFHVLCSWYIHPGGLWIALTYTEEKARVCLVLIPDTTPGGLWIALCRDRTMLGMKTRVQDSLWRRGRPTPFMRLCLRSHFVYTLSLLSWIFIWILYEYLYPYLSLGRAHCDKSSTAPFYLFLFLFYDSVFFLNLVMVTPIFYGDPLDDFIFYFVFVFYWLDIIFSLIPMIIWWLLWCIPFEFPQNFPLLLHNGCIGGSAETGGSCLYISFAWVLVVFLSVSCLGIVCREPKPSRVWQS